VTKVGERAGFDTVALIAVGGALGAPARYGVSRVLHVAPGSFPWATFVTNLSGAFVLAVFLSVLLNRAPAPRLHRLRLFFAVGFLGAFTTFSTMAVETVTLAKDGNAVLGVSYLLVSIAGGLAVTYLGIVVTRMVARPRRTA
jgi:fluoride exporter